MINKKKILAIIPARGGSQRLKNKNIKPLSGKELIYYTIREAKKSKYIDRLIISTDCSKISSTAKKYKCEVPFIRPKKYSKNSSTTNSVIKHSLKIIDRGKELFDYIVILQPTSPLRKKRHIDEAIEILQNKNVKNVVSVSEIKYPIEWTGYIDNKFRLRDFFANSKIKKSDYVNGKRYMLNGAIYIYEKNFFLSGKNVFKSNFTRAYIMPANNSIDIDDINDFNYAELLLKKDKSRK